MDEILKILVVDQNVNNADNIIKTVKSCGYAVKGTVVSSAEEFARVKQQFSPHFVIHSANAGKFSVQDLRAHLYKQDHEAHQTPIVALSENPSDQQARLLAEGANIVLPLKDSQQLQLISARLAEEELYIELLETKANSYTELDQRYRQMLDNSHDAVCYIHAGLHVYVNNAYLELFNIADFEQASVLSIHEVIARQDRTALNSVLKEISKNRILGTIALNFHTGKESFQANVEYSPITVEGQVCAQFILRTGSQQQPKKPHQQPGSISAPNIENKLLDRQAIITELQQAVESVHAGQSAATFMQIDIANIKTIQNKFGEGITDRLHAGIAQALKSVCHKEDRLAKISDQSFAILSALNDEPALSALGDALLAAVNNSPIKVKNQPLVPEIYMGAIILDAYLDDASDVLAAAKLMCVYAWENQIQKLYVSAGAPESLTGTLLDQKWAQELRDAIHANRLNLLFQPVVSVAGESEDRYQVYTQLLSKEGGKISVAELLPSIERSGVSVMLDRWVTERALKKLSEHSPKKPGLIFFIKLTAGTLSDGDFIAWLQAQCKQYQINPARLVFGIREENIVSNLKESRDFAGRLRQLSCQIAIDAFGISQEPARILSVIPAQYLKLNFQLMAGFKNTDSDRVSIIKNICEQAKAKNTLTIAPFVDSAEVLSQVWSINSVDFVSGDFFSEPGENLEYDFSSAIA